ncbi:MAG: peptidase S8 [Bellilinea sp.]|nr:MAG: peptidase S8 [Bellilinea sp.]
MSKGYRFFYAFLAGLLVLSLIFGSSLSSVQAQNGNPPRASLPDDVELMPGIRELLSNPNQPVYIVAELQSEPATVVYGRFKGVRAETELAAETQAQVERVKQEQQVFLNALLAEGIVPTLNPQPGDEEFLVYQVQRVYNGVALRVQAGRIEQIARLPGVKAIHRLTLKELDHTSSVPLIKAPEVWNVGLGNKGDNIKVGIIDTGIDYLHLNFGGPGTPAAYLANDTEVVGDVPNYPGAKVVGGYDFVGDNYNAGGTPAQQIPQPDYDPMDCNGHGSHVAGTVGGYGIYRPTPATKATYFGPYGPGMYGAVDFALGPGVAPGAQLYALRVFGCSGSTAVTDLAIEWAVDPNGDGIFTDRLDVINMSLGAGFGSEFDTSAIASNNAAQAGVIVVASAGNSYNTYYITGSPGVATRAISVASSVDAGEPYDGFEVITAPSGHSAIVGPHPSSNSANYDWYANPDTTAPLKAAPAGNLGGCSAFSPGYFSGTIALIDWTLVGGSNECGSATRTDNVQAAGGLGVIMVYPSPVLPIAIAGNASIPATITIQPVGDALKAALTAGEVTVRLTKDYNAAINVLTPDQVDTLSAFSSRGPRRVDNALKPDLAAPGQSIASVDALTGNGAISFNGTSMAAPHVAGMMALLRQLRPTWSVEELKALAMNTANYDLYTGLNQTGDKHAPSRVGTGRVDAQQAASSFVVMYNAEDEGLVSVSFGDVKVVTTAQAEKQVKVVNKHPSQTFTYTAALENRLTVPGVTYKLLNLDGTPLTSITLAPNQTFTFKVRMEADASLMTHVKDPALAATQAGNSRHFLSEAAALIKLTPPTSATYPALRLSVYSVPRAASAMDAVTPEVNLSLYQATGTFDVVLGGTKVSDPDVPSLVTAFEWLGEDEDTTAVPSQLRHVDIRHVGVMSDANYNTLANTFIYFAIVTDKPWTTPNEVEFDILIDVDQDGTDDFVLYNTALTENGQRTDVFVGRLLKINSGFTGGVSSATYYLNGFPAHAVETSPLNTNVVFMWISATNIGLTGTDGVFDFYIETYSRDQEDDLPVDITELYTYDALNPAVDTINTISGDDWEGLALYYDQPSTLTFGYDLTNYPTAQPKGVLLMHHHNAQIKAEAIPFNISYFQYLPVIGK